MAYATQQDIIAKYGETELIISADHDQDGLADPDVVERGLTDASDEIDTYLGRYTLPLSPVPAVLKPLCIDIALYKMSTATAVTEEKRKRYEDAIRLMTRIAEGKVILPQDKPATSGGQGGASFSANDRLFTRDQLRGY